MDCRNQPVIHFAKSVSDVISLKNDYAKIIMDRSRPITEDLVSALITQGVMGYAGRNPQPAFDADGNLRITDLDLLSFLVPLAARNAVIEIPEYRNQGPKVQRKGERKIGANRFGPIMSLVSNQKAFSFSVKIHDQTIISKERNGRESVGAYRNFMVVDGGGNLYDGWGRIFFDPASKENAFLKEKHLLTDDCLYFKHFVHPNRWKSVFGAPHLLKKMLLARLTDEARFYRREVDRLHLLGIYSSNGGSAKPSRAITHSGATKQIAVETMEMLLTMPKFFNEYQPVPNTEAGLIEAYRRQKMLTYSWKPAVQFVTRANEAAFFKFGLQAAGKARVASWLKKCRWVAGKKSPRSALYQILKLSDSMSLFYRLKTITARVAA
jgi:hypothetical protein